MQAVSQLGKVIRQMSTTRGRNLMNEKTSEQLESESNGEETDQLDRSGAEQNRKRMAPRDEQQNSKLRREESVEQHQSESRAVHEEHCSIDKITQQAMEITTEEICELENTEDENMCNLEAKKEKMRHSNQQLEAILANCRAEMRSSVQHNHHARKSDCVRIKMLEPSNEVISEILREFDRTELRSFLDNSTPIEEQWDTLKLFKIVLDINPRIIKFDYEQSTQENIAYKNDRDMIFRRSIVLCHTFDEINEGSWMASWKHTSN